MALVWKVACVVLAGAITLVEAKYAFEDQVNGCSVPIKVSYWTEYEPICNRHDVCYSCGAKYDWERKDCDNAFLQGMLKWCSDHPGQKPKHLPIKTRKSKRAAKKSSWGEIGNMLWNDPSKIGQGWALYEEYNRLLREVRDKKMTIDEFCISMATVYHDGVRDLAESHYETESPDWCDDEASKTFGDPYLQD